MIPFVDLKAQYGSIKEEVNAAIQGVLESCQFTLGSEVAAFEREFAAYCQTEYGIGVNTGTSALHLALLAAGVGPGDEVVTVPFTFVATVAAIHYTGARPVFVDIEPRSFTMDVTTLERAITEKTRDRPNRQNRPDRPNDHNKECSMTEEWVQFLLWMTI